MNMRLHIERLVLEGIDLESAQRPVLQAALETELGRLLAEGDVSPDLRGGIAMSAVRANGFQMSGESDPVRLGQRIAGSVYGGLGK